MPDRPVIVHYVHRPKRPPRKKPKAAAAVPVVVTATKRSIPKARLMAKMLDDPEADARVKAFFARMIRPP